jgi:hypothetical protein
VSQAAACARKCLIKLPARSPFRNSFFLVFASSLVRTEQSRLGRRGEARSACLPGSARFWQVDTYPAQIVAVAAIQELNAKLDIERADNAALKVRLDALEQCVTDADKP